MVNNKCNKVVFIGDTNTGKTCLNMRLIKDEFSLTENSTIGAAFSILKYNDKKYEIWDTAGQERYLAMSMLYYRYAAVYLIVFSANNLKSLEKVNYFIDRIINDVEIYGKFIVICNKIDLVNEGELKNIQNLFKLKTEKYDFDIEFILSSAKTGQGCEEIKKVIEKNIHYAPLSDTNNNIVLDEIKNEPKCCTYL